MTWKQRPFSEVAELINGRGFKPHEWSKEGLPIIRIQNLNGEETFNYFSGDFDEKILVKPGQLLFAWSGSRGTSFGPHLWRGPEGVLNYHTWKVNPNRDLVTSEFLNYLLRWITSRIEAKAHGAGSLVHVQKWWMEKYIVSIPEKSEQNDIVEKLSTWDRATELQSSLIKSYLILREQFTADFINAEAGDESVSLSEIGEINPSRQRGIDEMPVSFIAMADVSESGQLKNRQTRMLSEVSKGFTAFIENDTLVAKITPCFENGKGCLATGLENEIGFGSTEFHVIRPKTGIDPRLIYFLTITRKFRRVGANFMTGSAGQKRLSVDFLENVLIKKTAIENQTQICDLLSSITEIIHLHQVQLDFVRAQRAGLLNYVFGGS